MRHSDAFVEAFMARLNVTGVPWSSADSVISTQASVSPLRTYSLMSSERPRICTAEWP